MKQKALSYLSTQKEKLELLSNKLFNLSEESYKEYNSSKLICNFLQEYNFIIEKNLQNINTAFKATYGSGHPIICFTCEYDAVKEKGHLTGHNLSTMIHISSAISLAHILPKLEKEGTIIVIGCPGEYLGGSKQTLFKQNQFDDIDAIFSIQVNTSNCEVETSASVIPININFKSDYQLTQTNYRCNFSSLDASLLLCNILKTLEKGINCYGTIDYIISESANDPFVKAYDSTIKILIRAKNINDAKHLKEKILSISNYISDLLNIKNETFLYQPPNESLKSNKTLSRLLKHNLKESGITHLENNQILNTGISLGGISTKIPTTLYLINITSKDIEYGTIEFAKATLKPSAIDIALKASSALTNTAIDLFECPHLIEESFSEINAKENLLY
ncbi:MAG: M20 family peptidase [Sarcina sp.]